MDIDQIGPYTIERRIGAGGMGTVYLGRHRETGEPAAVKVLSASLAREEGFLARFQREIQALEKLTNPHIVRFRESGIDGETPYYVMEHVEGETLTARLRREGRLSWREAIDIAVQVCTALKAAHDAGVVHRDLKPSNLLLGKDGTVKLSDFGVAQLFAGTRLTATGGVIGTAEYMSPEQAQGSRATKRSDLYSLGAVLYAMLTGRPPFTGKTSMDVMHKHRYARFDRPSLYAPEIPHWLDDLVCQLLEKDPDKRPPDAYVLSRRLQEIVKKVEIASLDATLAAEGTGELDETLPVVGRRGGPGEGTLMRDLVRAEIERSEASSTLASLFNNTWVLLALLALLIAGGVWWFSGRGLSQEEMFEAGAAVMRQPEGPEWSEAREDYFEPLLEQDPERWREKIEPYLRRIELYELKRQARRGARLGRNRPQASGEAVRLLQLAHHYREIGEVDRARRILLALTVVLADDDERRRERELARQMLSELAPASNEDSDRDELVRSALDRAAALARAGELESAREVWRSLRTLYAADDEIVHRVAKAEAELAGGMNRGEGGRAPVKPRK